MNCVWFEKRLDELLDERLPVDSDIELNEHAEACPPCARLLADHQALLAAIEVFVRPESRCDLPGRILAERIVAEATLEPVSTANVLPRAGAARPANRERRALPRSAAWIAATVAAALLVGAGVMEWGAVHHSGSVATSKVSQLKMPNMAIDKSAPFRDANYRNPLPTVSVAEAHSLAGLIGPQQRTLMEQMTDGLKPVTHSMSAALNALRRTLPGSETPARSS